MKTQLRCLFIVASLFAGIHQSAAQGTRFFRISGPAATTITAVQPNGAIVWSNAQPGATYTIQAASSLGGETHWVDYVGIPTSNSLTTNVVIALNPPAGMALIPAGVFTMGDTLDGESDALPTVTVNVSAFYMDVNLVSLGQWQPVYNWAVTAGYGFDNAGSGNATNEPVQNVDWYDAVLWCNARSQQAGRTPVYFLDAGFTQVYNSGEVDALFVNHAANGYRLPTEAEWEKAARGGLSGQRFPWGNIINESLANYEGDTAQFTYDLGPSGYNAAFTNGVTPYTSPPGYFAPNGYGLYDMAGNLWEWCWDWYATPYAGGSDPQGPASGTDRVFRGGSWLDHAVLCRTANRFNFYPSVNTDYIGFRSVLNAGP